MRTRTLLFLLSPVALLACEKIPEHSPEPYSAAIPLDKVAQMLSELPLETVHLNEVYRAVNSSSGNGYDEEYMMKDLFETPGQGVGGHTGSKAPSPIDRPLRDLILDYASQKSATKSGGEDWGWIERLCSSDLQIYWPYSEDWDGETMPVFTYDPGNDEEINVGWRVVQDADGGRQIERIEVDEALAQTCPVWVVNRNSDSGFCSLEVMRREHPEWDNGGGALIVGGPSSERSSAFLSPSTFSSSFAGQPVSPSSGPACKIKRLPTATKALVIKDLTMNRHYDSWFAGGSEFFIKAGSVADFQASTEAELQLYSPAITDFMVVVKRSQKGKAVPCNTVLVSDWTQQLTHIAFMIVEDDGGKQTQWKCSAMVKVNSKSYGFELSIPLNTRDDIVWRGQLSRNYIEATDKVSGHFGDVDITFEIVDY